MSGPKVSIVLPVYNGQRFLRGSIASCLGQTHRDLELIVVDDCSTDATPDIVRSFDDARVRYFRNETNQRLPRSLNIGFRHATGEYLTWTSDDNEYEPTAIAKMLECLTRDPEAGFVCADYWKLEETTGQKERVHIPTPLDLRKKNDICACFLYTRKAYEKTGDYDPDYEIVEDYDYWIRISKRFPMKHIAEPLYLYRYHASSLTTAFSAKQALLDGVLKCRNGYLSLWQTGWKGLHYFEDMSRSPLAEAEKKKRLRETLSALWRLSPFFYVQLMTMIACCRAWRGLKQTLGVERRNA